MVLSGRAWSGEGAIEAVEVGGDGDWAEAELGEPVAGFAWRDWRFRWEATVGEHELACRATDSAGAVQPLHQAWNYQGMGNNMVQRVPVTVR